MIVCIKEIDLQKYKPGKNIYDCISIGKWKQNGCRWYSWIFVMNFYIVFNSIVMSKMYRCQNTSLTASGFAIHWHSPGLWWTDAMPKNSLYIPAKTECNSFLFNFYFRWIYRWLGRYQEETTVRSSTVHHLLSKRITIKSVKPTQTRWHIPDGSFNRILLHEYCCVFIRISLN